MPGAEAGQQTTRCCGPHCACRARASPQTSRRVPHSCAPVLACRKQASAHSTRAQRVGSTSGLHCTTLCGDSAHNGPFLSASPPMTEDQPVCLAPWMTLCSCSSVGLGDRSSRRMQGILSRYHIGKRGDRKAQELLLLLLRDGKLRPDLRSRRDGSARHRRRGRWTLTNTSHCSGLKQRGRGPVATGVCWRSDGSGA